MSRFILAFLVGVSTAAGQDLSVESKDYFAVWPGVNHLGGISYGVQGFWVITRDSSPELARRPWVQFRIPEISRRLSISSATLRLPLGNGDGTSIRNDWDILFYDADVTGDYAHFHEITNEAIGQIRDDVGSGGYYGMLDLDPSIIPNAWFRISSHHLDFHAHRYFDVELSPLAIRDLNESVGQAWSIGSGVRDSSSITMLNFWTDNPDFPSAFLDLTYGPPPPLGDFSGNGRVDQSDLDFVLLNWGIVDQEELDAVLITWGDGGLAAASVPEPAGVWIAAAVAIMAAVFRRWKCPH